MTIGNSYEMYIVQSGSTTRKHLEIITLPNFINFEIYSSAYAENRHLKIVRNPSGAICSSSDGLLEFTVYYRKIN